MRMPSSFDVMDLVEVSRKTNRLRAGRCGGFGLLYPQRQGQNHGHFPAWQGSHRRHPRAGRILRRGSADWSAVALGDSHCNVDMRDYPLPRETLVRLLHENQKFADYFLNYLLARTARVEADLADQLFNSSEMRLARALLLLANYGNDLGQEPMPVKVNQETLAALIGTTRPRVSVFLNKFRKLGLIKYNGKLEVQKALLNFVLNEQSHSET